MLLTAKEVTKAYAGESGRVPVLAGVSLTLTEGETLALTGESGSGKSTLLTLLAGLDRADGGSILLQGQALEQQTEAGLAALRRDAVGLIFQQFNLIPSLTVGQNLDFQARLVGRHDPIWLARLVEGLGLGEHLRKYPEALSGGQQQRVAVGRTLAARPALILADEPTGNLDEATGDQVAELLLTLVREAGSGLIVATHSERLAGRLGRRLHLTRGRLV